MYKLKLVIILFLLLLIVNCTSRKSDEEKVFNKEDEILSTILKDIRNVNQNKNIHNGIYILNQNEKIFYPVDYFNDIDENKKLIFIYDLNFYENEVFVVMDGYLIEFYNYKGIEDTLINGLNAENIIKNDFKIYNKYTELYQFPNGDNYIELPPTIKIQPKNIAVLSGQRAIFEVEAEGLGLYYKWYKNGNEINGAYQSIYIIEKTTDLDDKTIYSVLISNSSGNVKSEDVILQIIPESSNWIESEIVFGEEIIQSVDTSFPDTIIDTGYGLNKKSDIQLETEIQAALNKGGIIVFETHGEKRNIKITKQLYIPVQGKSSNNWNNDVPVIIDGKNMITFDGGKDINGNGGTRILEKGWKVNLTIQNIDFINANAENITSGRVDDDKSGGAINIENWDGSLYVINCNFTNCNAGFSGPDIGGGAVRCPGQKKAIFYNCTFSECKASNGGALNSLGSELWIINCKFIRNESTGMGGGADAGPNGKGGIGGAVYVDGISNNSENKILRIEKSVFENNKSNEYGGALFLYTYANSGSKSLIKNCRFTKNEINGTSAFGGAIYSQNSELNLYGTTFDENKSASMGGALWHLSNESSYFTNCTFTYNKSGNFASAIQLNGPVYISSCTIADNECLGDYGGAIRSGTPNETWLKNCILSNNLCKNEIIRNVAETYKDGGGNFQWPFSSNHKKAVENISFANPMLGLLEDNGGEVYTRKPSVESIVVNGGTDAQCIDKDQTGKMRNGRCDSGAVENLD